MDIILTLPICSAGSFGWLKPNGKWLPAICAELFKKYDILGFIADCYDILHLNSYECALHDVETLLKNRGVYRMIGLEDGMLLYHGSYVSIPRREHIASLK